MDEAEPTLPADLADSETQSIHAWSQADNAEAITTYIPRRSWKIPAGLAALAVAAVVTTGVVHEWPHTQPPAAQTTPVAPVAPKIQPPPLPALPATPDQRFIALLKQRGVIVVSPPLAINGAHETCTNLAKGYTAREIAEAEVKATPGANINTESTFVATAQEVYCPPPGAQK
jgi:hypothetical protein